MSVQTERWESRGYGPAGGSRRARERASALLCLLVLGAAVGCAHTPAPPPKREFSEAYIVGAPDELMITILPDPAIEREVRVRPDGMISIDLIGDVPASGRTIAQISADVEQRIARFKRGATVTIFLKMASSNAITVLGEVRSPQNFPLLKDTRVVEAIGQVGGPVFTASRGNIRVVRAGGGEAVVLRVNLNAIQGGDQTTNIFLKEGDIVYVPPTWWAQIGFVVQAILFPFNPLLGIGMGMAGGAVVP